jgi:MFS family permease
VLIVFAILYGFFGAGYSAIWVRMSTTVTDDVTSGPMVFGLLSFGKGIGNVVAGPVGGLLVSKPTGMAPALPYHWVIVFTGICMFASGFTICVRYAKLCRTLFVG